MDPNKRYLDPSSEKDGLSLSRAPADQPRPARNRSRWQVMWCFGIVAILVCFQWRYGQLDRSWFPFPKTSPRSALERARILLQQHPLIDGHNDLLIRLRLEYGNKLYENDFRERFENGSLSGHVDLARIKEGRYGGAFWSAFYTCQSDIDDFSDESYAPAQLWPDRFPSSDRGVRFTPDVRSAREDFGEGRIISPLGIEGLHQIGNSPSILRLYHALGVRYATLTWNCHNIYADAAVLTYLSNFTSIVAPPLHHGISPRGRALIREMNRLGMIVDLAHVSKDTLRDALVGREGVEFEDEQPWCGSAAPPIVSHSSAYTLCPHPRNVPDDILPLIKRRNSVVMVNFSPDFIACKAPSSDDPRALPEPDPENATLERVADHIMHIGEMIGYDHVGIGTDYDGIESTPRGLEDVSKLPHLVAELLRRGVSESDLVKVAGGNVLRVWEEVERVGREMRAGGALPLEDENMGITLL
ncbi:MAG: hypothetical protein Q9162_003935 [Coniocarpon cinnabarinum]